MSINIKILGIGCSKCEQTIRIVKEVIAENDFDATIEKVEDIMKIAEYNVLSTPAIIVNDQIKLKGRVPSKQEVLQILTAQN